MKQQLIRWLLTFPRPAYDSMKGRVWMKQKVKLWDRVRVRLARWLMGED